MNNPQTAIPIVVKNVHDLYEKSIVELNRIFGSKDGDYWLMNQCLTELVGQKYLVTLVEDKAGKRYTIYFKAV